MANRNYVQAQTFTLYGSGASIGDATLTLSDFNGIDGTPLTMADFGTKGFGTVEPANSTQEEAISWTGVTTNSNGSVTLTGVKSVGFVSPYIETANLQKSHAGGTRFVVTNTAGFYADLANKQNDETIAGTYTFTAPKFPVMDDSSIMPTLDGQMATKKYADELAYIHGSPNATTTVKGIVEIATSAETQAGTNTGGTGASLVALPSDIAANEQNKVFTFAVDSVGTDSYAITVTPAISAYAQGQEFTFKAGAANTGAASLNVNGKGAITIKKYVNGAISDLETNDILVNTMVKVVYNSTGPCFQLVSARATEMDSATAYEAQQFFSTTNMTGVEAETLTGGATSNADTLHTHVKNQGVDRVLNFSHSSPGVNNTSQKYTVLTKSIAGGTLGINDGLVFTVNYTSSEGHSSGSNGTVNPFSIKLGSQKLMSIDLSTNLATVHGSFRVYIFNNGSTGSQIYGFSSTGSFSTATDPTSYWKLNQAASLDTTQAQTFLVEVTLGTGSAGGTGSFACDADLQVVHF